MRNNSQIKQREKAAMACLDPVKKLTQGQKAESEIRSQLKKLIPMLGGFIARGSHSNEDDRKLIETIEDVIRNAEDLVQAHEKMVIQMNAATLKKVGIYVGILSISNQLHTIKPEIIRLRNDLQSSTNTENSSAAAAAADIDVPYYLWNYLPHCLLFPSGSKVPARRLIALWVAEGVVHSMNDSDQRDKEEIAEDRLNELVEKGVLVPISRKRNGKVKDCKIDDDKRVILLRKAGDWANRYSKKCRLVDRPVDDQAGSPDRPVDLPEDSPVDDQAGSPDRQVDHPEDCPVDEAGLPDHPVNHPEDSPVDDQAGSPDRQVDHPADDTANSHDHSFIRIDIDVNTNNLESFPSILKKVLKDKHVISFISFNTEEGIKPGELIGEFLRKCISDGHFNRLRVLDLEKVFRPNLAGTLGKLTTVKYLGLRWTYLEQLPNSVDELFNLQVLDVKHTYISVLPKSIWRMQYLRHLYLSEAYRTKFPQPPSQVSLTSLQTLWGAFVDDDTPIVGGLNRLLNIRKLGLSCRWRESKKAEMSRKLQDINKWIENLPHLESLRLKSRDENNEAANLHLTSLEKNTKLSSLYLLGILEQNIYITLPASLTHVTLSGTKLTVDPVEFLKQLNSLVILELLGQSVVCTKMHCRKESFPKLEVLRIWKLQNLTELIAEKDSLPELKEVIIRDCPKLELPDSHRLRNDSKFKLEQSPPESQTAGASTSQTAGANTSQAAGENTIPKTAGENTSQVAGENTIPAGENTKRKFTAEEKGKKVQL